MHASQQRGIAGHGPARRVVLAAVVCGVGLSFLSVTGCMRQRVKRPKTYPVTGVVTMAGQPLADATVMFDPVDGDGSGAIAVTDAEGRYKLTTFEAGDGARPGEYRIAFLKTILPGGKVEGPDGMAVVSGDPKNVLPPKLGDSAKSGFTATVLEGPGNTFDFAVDK